MSDNKELDGRRGIGPQSKGDDVFRRRMRLHQSWYRDQVLKVPYGTGHTKSRTSLYGNMLTKESAEAGLNFLTPRIFEVAKGRLDEQRTREGSGVVDDFRLFRNMLTSQTMCFNLFGELASDHQLATRLAQALWGDRIASVLDLRIEWAPQPAREYLNDRTAFDAFLEYKTVAGGVGFVGVETKLTEPFSEKDYDRLEYRRWMKQPCPWKENASSEVAAKVHNQLWRDHLLAWSLLRHPNSKYAEGRLAVVYHPEDKRCKRTIHQYRGLLNDADATFCDFDLAEIVSAWESLAGEWLSKFHQRYLALEDSEEGAEGQA